MERCSEMPAPHPGSQACFLKEPAKRRPRLFSASSTVRNLGCKEADWR